MGWTSPRTWAAGEKVTAALLNAHLRDNLKVIGDAWQTYTPTWTAASANPSIGNGALTGNYLSAGKLTMFSIEILMGSTTNYGSGAYSLSLPVTARSGSIKLRFDGCLFDASAGGAVVGTYPIAGVLSDANTIQLAGWPTTAGNTFRIVNATNIVTLDTGDRITVSGTYEAA